MAIIRGNNSEASMPQWGSKLILFQARRLLQNKA